MKWVFAAFLALFAGMATAQEVHECDWRASARNLVEPWGDNMRTFANGHVRLALLDTVEPTAGALHLLVISPPYGVLGEPQCRVISWRGSIGFAGLNFAALEASYDPASGLTFTLPGLIYLPEQGFANSARLSFTLNQASGEIFIELELGRE